MKFDSSTSGTVSLLDKMFWSGGGSYCNLYWVRDDMEPQHPPFDRKVLSFMRVMSIVRDNAVRDDGCRPFARDFLDVSGIGFH